MERKQQPAAQRSTMLDVFDDCRQRKPTDAAILVTGVDREVADLARIRLVDERDDTHYVSGFVHEGKRFPLTVSGPHVRLRENDQRDGLVIRHER